mmetsp:Transcript_57921/g.169342  ORF Transcript_57921/g.169342 Transcript_57921/m.169342 type:complete len:206 (-) Transcript_57921:8-625(-)
MIRALTASCTRKMPASGASTSSGCSLSGSSKTWPASVSSAWSASSMASSSCCNSGVRQWHEGAFPAAHHGAESVTSSASFALMPSSPRWSSPPLAAPKMVPRSASSFATGQGPGPMRCSSAPRMPSSRPAEPHKPSAVMWLFSSARSRKALHRASLTARPSGRQTASPPRSSPPRLAPGGASSSIAAGRSAAKGPGRGKGSPRAP